MEEKYSYMTSIEAIDFLEGLKAEESFNGITELEAHALDMAIKALSEIDRLRKFNQLYYTKIAELITLRDNDKDCSEVENWMRTERDRVEILLNQK